MHRKTKQETDKHTHTHLQVTRMNRIMNRKFTVFEQTGPNRSSWHVKRESRTQFWTDGPMYEKCLSPDALALKQGMTNVQVSDADHDCQRPTAILMNNLHSQPASRISTHLVGGRHPVMGLVLLCNTLHIHHHELRQLLRAHQSCEGVAPIHLTAQLSGWKKSHNFLTFLSSDLGLTTAGKSWKVTASLQFCHLTWGPPQLERAEKSQLPYISVIWLGAHHS